MQKKYKILIAVILSVVVILLAVFATLIFDFMESGVHVLGRYAHIQIQEKCYLFSANGQLIGNSVMTVSGYLRDPAGTETGQFDGFVDVAAYPISVEEGFQSFRGSIQKEYIKIGNKGRGMIYPETEVFYSLRIIRTDPNIILLFIEQKNQETILAICAETEEEAWSNIRRYEQLKAD